MNFKSVLKESKVEVSYLTEATAQFIAKLARSKSFPEITKLIDRTAGGGWMIAPGVTDESNKPINPEVFKQQVINLIKADPNSKAIVSRPEFSSELGTLVNRLLNATRE